MVNDQLADFLTRIRNAGMARHTSVDTTLTKMNQSVADILVREGYVKAAKLHQENERNYLRVFLKYESGDLRKPLIQGLERISKPGLRRYVSTDKLPRIRNGMGVAILTTSKGVMTEREARKQKVGGEYLCSVW
ncbi:MAG: 30S ribosomal protein S8 [Proteobacteria bacterium]|jgi:small subunit ribosomal protein S8|nr:30S ribosomal protein S8 [Pseudomonadota bacterium]